MLSYPNFSFQITHKDPHTKARCGVLDTPHGSLETPAFIFCATKAAIKGLTPSQMKDAGTQIILANTYHLLLQPGSALVEKMGGLHKFMGWQGPMLTDSGGFQIFSLGHGSVASEIKGRRMSGREKKLSHITEEGATFRSYVDGRLHTLTPEYAMQVQRELGPDLVVVLDECTPFHVDKEYTRRSMQLSHRWGLRSLAAFKKHHTGKQAIYGIIQGGVYPDLRRDSATFVAHQPFFGHAIGGSLGAEKAQMYDVVAMTTELLPSERPIHLLGIGGISDIFNGVKCGIDTFDCVHPTRLARHGGALVRADVDPEERPDGREHLNLNNAKYREDDRPIDSSCACATCETASRAYLHHLLRAKEMLALQLITQHNVFHMNRLLAAIRVALKNGTLDAEEKLWVLPSQN
ncbi:MAG: tRNA guanosine(34) transglycosylase Tgt [Alphaproteobacteria bacterium]|nr:tRNA guanosine(34) transglycosylase Tgt [Alphaproteobacteria bacterium]